MPLKKREALITMTRCFVKGLDAFRTSQCKNGYNICYRFLVNKQSEEPNDKLDLFEWLGNNKTLKQSQKAIEKLQKGRKALYEIVELNTKQSK